MCVCVYDYNTLNKNHNKSVIWNHIDTWTFVIACMLMFDLCRGLKFVQRNGEQLFCRIPHEFSVFQQQRQQQQFNSKS